MRGARRLCHGATRPLMSAQPPSKRKPESFTCSGNELLTASLFVRSATLAVWPLIHISSVRRVSRLAERVVVHLRGLSVGRLDVARCSRPAAWGRPRGNRGARVDSQLRRRSRTLDEARSRAVARSLIGNGLENDRPADPLGELDRNRSEETKADGTRAKPSSARTAPHRLGPGHIRQRDIEHQQVWPKLDASVTPSSAHPAHRRRSASVAAWL